MEFQNVEQRLAMRTLCEESQLMFTRFFFKQRERAKMTVNWHHIAVARAFDMVLALEIPRLLITLPPGFTKTMFLIDSMARGYGVDPMCRNIHITYNSQLATNNSQILLDTLELPEYKSMWNTRLRQDSTAKRRWNTKHGGGLVSTGIGGTVTGFRAGRVTPHWFSGMMALDDLIKPSDVYSKIERDKTNGKMNDTIRSRLMLPNTPIVMTMQRLHDMDPAGFVLRGGTGDEWVHLNIPARIKPEHIRPGKDYARKYPYGKPLVFDDVFKEGWTWPLRVDKKEYAKIKHGNPMVAAAQYDQDPTLIEGNFIKGKWLHFYRELPELKHFKRIVAIADTALEAKKHNDRTVWMVWGEHKDGHVYLLDYHGDRLEVPDITKTLMRVWDRFRDSQATKLPRIQMFYVEKKASGHGIIQSMVRNGVNTMPIERSRDKVSRAIESIPALRTGALLFPAKNIKTFLTSNKQHALMMDEILHFSAEMDHSHDDFCDCIFDAADIFYNNASLFRQVFG